MDNPNMPIIAISKTGEWVKVLDSQLPDALARLGNDAETYRVDKDAKVIRKNGQLYIRGIAFPLNRG